VVQTSSSLAPWTGLGVFGLWVLASIGAGWYLLRRRDVK
jgi:ABC-2 type transport system permease protein